jgi:hypothetical protein
MVPNLSLILLGSLAVITIISYACLSLLRLSQQQEDAENEHLWQHLLEPSRPNKYY